MKDEVKLLRHTLNAIDISDVKDEDQSESDRLKYCNAIYQAWEVLEKDIKKMLWEQIIKNNEADDYDKLNYGRGVCTGFDILFERWKLAVKEYESKLSTSEPLNKHNPLPEL